MKIILATVACGFIIGCSSAPMLPLPRAQNIDLQQFMGDWYVIANKPTFLEKNAYNALESYAMNDDGTIATTFSFNKNSFDGERVSYHPQGFVNSEDNSQWGMQFIWPIKAEYIIAYVSPDYQQTIIARSNRDYVWIMARNPIISDETYNHLINLCVEMGYRKSDIRKIPHQISSQSPQAAIPSNTNSDI